MGYPTQKEKICNKKKGIYHTVYVYTHVKVNIRKDDGEPTEALRKSGLDGELGHLRRKSVSSL